MTSLLPLLCIAIFAGVPREVSSQAPQLALQIRSDQDNLRAGDEILISFVITNVGTTSYKFTDRNYDRSGRMGEYRLRAYDERGTPVPDPRTLSRVPQGYIGGGLGTVSELQPGQRFSKTIALNLWAVVVEPGLYTLRGTYATENGRSVESPPLLVRVLPRGDTEMADYIEELATQLKDARDPDKRTRLVRRLMYTADRRAVMPLLELSQQDNNTAFWIGEAFSYYLPNDDAALAEAVAAIRHAGWSQSSVRVLEQLDAPTETIKQLIGEALMHTDSVRRSEAALAAQGYPDDRFMQPLIELAMTGSAETRVRAVYALALNRTDAGVAALKSLRRDPDAEIRRVTDQAIEAAYRMSDAARGRPLRRDDFPDIAERPFSGDAASQTRPDPDLRYFSKGDCWLFLGESSRASTLLTGIERGRASSGSNGFVVGFG
jgi:hypothetical protein